jgi:hypothetical protein
MISTAYIAGKAIDIPASALKDVFNPANQRPFAKACPVVPATSDGGRSKNPRSSIFNVDGQFAR